MAGRHSRSKRLGIWMNGQRVGRWSVTATGESVLNYDNDWLVSEEGRPLSLSLPFQAGNPPHRGQVVVNYFDNLLPDSDHIRRRLAGHYKTQSTDPFDLLEQIGRDCVGAVQLLADDKMPEGIDRIDGKFMTEADVAKLLKGVTTPLSTPLNTATAAGGGTNKRADFEDLRLSIAGAQEKTALLWHDGQWVLPRGATPTTHILKLPLGRVGIDQSLDMSTSVENEWLCLRILKAYGLDVPQAAILQFEDQKVLAVERFDRLQSADGRSWLRLPQEDFCQVTGRPSHLKYESDGGAGIDEIATWLQSSQRADKDLRDFLTAQVVFWLLAATDGHAKNFSIRLLRGGRYHLTPFYDVLSAWPITRTGVGTASGKIAPQKLKLAMAVKGKNRHDKVADYKLADIRRSHFVLMGTRFGLGRVFEGMIENLIAITPDVVATVIQDLPNHYRLDVLDSICENLLQSAKRLEAQRSSFAS